MHVKPFALHPFKRKTLGKHRDVVLARDHL